MSHRDTVGVFVISTATQVIGYVSTFFLAHKIGVNNAGLALLGVLGLYLLIASTVQNMGELRLGTGYIYHTARGDSADANLSSYGLGAACAGLLSVTVVALISLPLLHYLNAPEVPAYFLFLTIPLLGIGQNLYTNVQIANGNSTKGQYPLLLRSSVQVALLVPVVFLWPTLTGLALAYFFSYVVAFLWSFLNVHHLLKRPSWLSFKKVMGYSWPLAGSLAFGYLSNNLLPYLVSAAFGTVAVTLYLAGNGLRIALLALPSAVCLPVFPLVARLYKNGGPASAQRAIRLAMTYSNWFVAPACMVFVVFASPLIRILYGAPYATASTLMALLVLSSIPLSMTQILTTVLSAIGRQRLEFFLNIGQVVVLVLGFLALQSLGPIASGIALMASSLFAIGFNTYFSHLFKVGLGWAPFLPVILASPLLLGIWVPWKLEWVAVSLLFYLLASIVFGLVTETEVRKAGGILGLSSSTVLRFVGWVTVIHGAGRKLGFVS